MDISLHLHDPDELKAFARFCNDMADVREKQHAKKPRDWSYCTSGPAMGPAAVAELSQPQDWARVDLAPPPHEEAQRAAGAVPVPPAPQGVQVLGTLLPVPPAQTPSGFDTAALDQDAAKLFALGVNPMTGQPVGATPPAVPLPPSDAPSTAAAAVFPTALAALPAGPLPGSTLPVPQFAQSAAAPTAAATTSPAGGVELDADGLPWDARIHSSSKEKNKDGRWRSKRGLNDEGLVKRIEAELRATMAVPVPPAAPAAPALAIVAQIPQPPVATGSAPATSAADPTDFASLVAILTPKLTPERIPTIFAIVQSFGLPGLPALQQRPDLVPAVWAKLKEVLA